MTLPVVSLIVPMRNERRHIEDCLRSIFAQQYPGHRLEVWVIDGQSTDGSWQIVEALFEGRENCHLLKNPKIVQVAAWNQGIALATGEIVGIVSAHAELGCDYVMQAVATLQETGADMVGGPMRASGQGLIGAAVALATSSPFGVGGARFHFLKEQEVVDTAYMGVCRRSLYERIGAFDEEMICNEDDELSYRLLEQGGRIVCNPAIQSRYFNRSSFRSLWRQYFRYGYWKVRVMQKHPGQIRSRQLVPAAFVTVLALSLLMAPFSLLAAVIFSSAAGAYVIANLVASFFSAGLRNSALIPILPATFAVLHLAYGFGFLAGLVAFCDRWGDRQLRSGLILAREASRRK